MRVINDKEEKTESSDFGFLSLLSHVLLTAFGVATFILSPLPIIFSHMRLVEPWPRLATLFGAVVALLFLDVPVGLVLIAFAFGLYVGDGVAKKTPFWKLFSSSLLLSLTVGFVALLLTASLEHVRFLPYWTGLIDEGVKGAEAILRTGSSFDWNQVRALLLYQGPFLYVAGSILSFWISVGFAAHLGWMNESHPYGGNALRSVRLPNWMSILFIGLFVANAFVTSDLFHLVGGVFRVVSAFMFVQGMVTISRTLAMRRIRPFMRSIFYVFSVVLGFYMVVGIGVFSPWILRKKQAEAGVLTRPNEEAV